MLKDSQISGGRRIATLAIALSFAGVAGAANLIWQGGAIGAYENVANWPNAELPEFGDTIVFNTTPSVTVSFASNATVARLLHNEGDLRIELNGNAINLISGVSDSASWTSTSNVPGDGDVEIVGGTINCVWANISTGLNSASSVTLSDPAARFNASQSIRVGAFGDGGMTIENGAAVQADNDFIIGQTNLGMGTVFVRGASSSLLVADQIQVGAAGIGTLNLSDGGTASCQSVFVSSFDQSVGALRISGLGSEFVANNTIGIAFDGASEVIVSSQGRLEGNLMRVGFLSGSDGVLEVRDPGSELLIVGQATVGSSGSGEILLSDGAIATFGDLAVGASEGTALVSIADDSVTTTVAQTASVGAAGPGRLEFLGGSSASVAEVSIGIFGRVTLEGGEIDGDVVNLIGPLASPDSGLRGSGVLTGTVNNNGNVRPEPVAGSFNIQGDYRQEAGGALEVIVRAPLGIQPTASRLDVAGVVELSGALRIIDDISSMRPPLGSSVPIIAGATSVTGGFSSIDFEPLDNGLRWITVNTGAGVDLVATIPGDLTGDAVVDASDLAALLAAWGQADANADLTSDGVVGSDDLAALISAWG